MAGKKQQAQKPIEEDEEVEGEGWDNTAEVDADASEGASGRMRDWRDVEKYREMRELRRLVGDDFDFTDILGEIPLRNETSRKPDPKGKVTPLKGVIAKPAAPAPSKAAAPPVKGAAHATKAAPAAARNAAVGVKGSPPKAASTAQPAPKKAAAKPAPKASKPEKKPAAAKGKPKPGKAKKKK